MRTSSVITRFAVLSAVAVALAPPSAARAQDAGADGLAPHKAVYTVSLDAARDSTRVTDIGGSIAYGVQRVCDGWVLAQSGTMNIQIDSGQVASQALHYSSWENDAGTAYRFTVTHQGEGQDIVLGRATMSPGEGGRATFMRPEDAAFDLPADTLFPLAHTRFMIAGARAGETSVESHIFEGSEVEGANLLVVFISPLSDKAQSIVDGVGGDLLDRPGWNFRLAYFDPASQSGEPLYEIEADMLDNGVAPRWVLDYGAYSVEMTLGRIEAEPMPDC